MTVVDGFVAGVGSEAIDLQRPVPDHGSNQVEPAILIPPARFIEVRAGQKQRGAEDQGTHASRRG